VLAQRSLDEAEEAGCVQGDGVVLTEDSTAAGDGVGLELRGVLILAQRPQD
jgi:hypothetical protein